MNDDSHRVTPVSAPRLRRRRATGRGAVLTAAAGAIALLLAACGSGGTDSDSPTSAGAGSSAGSSSSEATGSTDNSDYLGCLIVSSAGVADRAFNQQAWDAMQQAQKELGIQVKYLAQSGTVDFPQIGDQFVQQGCNLIVGMGFDTAETIQNLATANPDKKFVVIDTTLDKAYDNATSLHFQIDQASFLAGYLAAGMSKTGTVGTVGNVAIPPVELYLDGYVNGVNYYNQAKGKSVKPIGWDVQKRTGVFVGNFTDSSKGKLLTESEIQQGADVIMPLTPGGDTAIREAGGIAKGKYYIYPDSDGCVSNPSDCDLILTSVLKNIKTSLFDVVKKTVSGSFPAGTYEGNLSNGGVGLAPFHQAESNVPADLQSDLKTLQADIAAGKVKTS